MSLLFEFHSVIEYPAYSLSPEQHEPLLKEEPITVTARTEREAKNTIFEDCLKEGHPISPPRNHRQTGDTMKHDFDDSTIINANEQAVKNLSYAPSRITTTYLRGFLNALPEPATDGWQECRFEDIRKGDQIKYVTEISTVTPHKPVTEIDQGDIIIGNQIRITNRTDTKYYRIPAPVQHPDPVKHPVIIIYRPNGNGETPVSYAWTGQHYRSFDGQEYFSANEITDWSPAKVVEDDR